MIKINYSYTILFAATVAGIGTAADSTPTAVLWRNGSASGVSVTVSTTAQTGLYKAVFTTDAGWAAADFLELYVTATIAGTAGYLAKVWSSTEIGAAELDSEALNPVLEKLPTAGRAATADDVSPTIDFNPTISPTELSEQSIDAIRLGLALESSLDNVVSLIEELEISGGGLTSEQSTLLTAIGRAVDGLRGPAMNWNGNVGPGGVLQLTLGDDHETVIANDLPIRVKDPGGLLYAKLTAAGVSLQWAAGQATTGGMITGTVGTPTHDEETEITTVIVQVPNCAATGNILAPYKWQLQRTINNKRARMLQGSLNLHPDMIGA